MDVGGRSALVTGGASGLSLATAHRLLNAGATVVAVDLPNADRTKLDCLGNNVRVVAADLTDEDAVDGAVRLK